MDFDDIRAKPESSSDSDYKRNSIEPNYDTENGGNKKGYRVSPDAIKLDFPASMIRKIASPTNTDITNRKHTMQRLMDTDYASAIED